MFATDRWLFVADLPDHDVPGHQVVILECLGIPRKSVEE